LKTSTPVVKETERQNEKETHQMLTENAQSGYRWLLNTPRIFEGIPAKRAEVRQPKLKQPHSLSRFVKH
jgi:predicted secreted protein